MSVAPISSRIYVGNINFNATEDELKEFFGEFPVSSVEIPSKTVSRNNKAHVKRLGFGFVQFENGEDAAKAIEKFNGVLFKQRQIYAKQAMPPATEEEKKQKAEAFIAKKKLLREQKAQKKAQHKQTEELKSSAETETEGDGETVANGEEPSDKTQKPKPKPKRVRKKAPKRVFSEKSSNGVESTSNGDSEHTRASPSKSVIIPEGSKSKTTVFVTNLDNQVNSKMLLELFEPLNPVWAHVPVRKVAPHILRLVRARKVSLYNKGIAFVKFSSEEIQLKAIEDYNGHELNGKNIVLEVAIDKEFEKGSPEVKDEEKGEENTSDAPVVEEIAGASTPAEPASSTVEST